MPRARRRRAARRSSGRSVLVAVATAVVLALLVGSIVEINAQSAPYRATVDTSYAALANPVVASSNRTGATLSTLLARAADPAMDRATLQQGLDQAVSDSAGEARAIAQLTPPSPVGSAAAQLTAVFDQRAEAVRRLRASIGSLLGMRPASGTRPQIAVPQATEEMAKEGSSIEGADARYAAVAKRLGHAGGRGHLLASVWAPATGATPAPLSATGLGALAGALGTSPNLAVVHQLIISGLGLVPPAVASGGPGAFGAGCANPTSLSPGGPATILPPTAQVTAEAEVTNCGNVTETKVDVSAKITMQLAPGQVVPKGSGGPSSVHRTVTLAPGRSRALALGPLGVAAGVNYLLAITVSVPEGQADLAGTAQSLLLQIPAFSCETFPNGVEHAPVWKPSSRPCP